jgi:hypothetical protein
MLARLERKPRRAVSAARAANDENGRRFARAKDERVA